MKIDLKKMEEEYTKQHPPDFITHLNYVSCLNSLSKGLNLKSNFKSKNKIKESKNIKKKLNLIKLIKKNLEEEHRIILKNPDFSEISVPWIAVKAYYLLFNLFLIIRYLFSGDETSFNSPHYLILKDIKRYIREGKINFNKEIFNRIYGCLEIHSFKIIPGYNIRFIDVDEKRRFNQILKKLLLYKIEDLKRRRKIGDFRKRKNREILGEFMRTSDLNICEFFYWYRIKSNYRDLKFLDKDISSNQFSEFYKNYFELTFNFYKAFENLVNDLAERRLGKEILR